jgi:hypothetical protein
VYWCADSSFAILVDDERKRQRKRLAEEGGSKQGGSCPLTRVGESRALFQIDGGYWEQRGDGKDSEVQFVKELYGNGWKSSLSISRAWLDTSFLAIDLSVDERGRESSSISNR